MDATDKRRRRRQTRGQGGQARSVVCCSPGPMMNLMNVHVQTTTMFPCDADQHVYLLPTTPSDKTRRIRSADFGVMHRLHRNAGLGQESTTTASKQATNGGRHDLHGCSVALHTIRIAHIRLYIATYVRRVPTLRIDFCATASSVSRFGAKCASGVAQAPRPERLCHDGTLLLPLSPPSSLPAS